MTNYAEVLSRLDPSLPLSPYSELAATGLRAGFESVYDVPMSGISAPDVSTVVQNVVSTVAIAAIETVADIPFVGQAAAFVLAVVRGIAESETAAALHEAETRRSCQLRERAMRPVGTGFGGTVMPADVLGRYLWYADGRASVVPDRSNGAELPSLGDALWLYGYGYAPTPYPHLVTHQADEYVRKKLGAIEAGIVPADAAGPRITRREQFRAVAQAISETRNDPESDGGASVYWILLDVLLDQAPRATPAWIEWLADHYAIYPPDEPPRLVGPGDPGGLPPECTLPESRAGVARMIESWRLTLDPTYRQDRERAAALRRDVDEEVRRMMRRLPPSTLRALRTRISPAVRPSRARRVAVLAAAGAGALALARPDLALSAATGVRGLLRRI